MRSVFSARRNPAVHEVDMIVNVAQIVAWIVAQIVDQTVDVRNQTTGAAVEDVIVMKDLEIAMRDPEIAMRDPEIVMRDQEMRKIGGDEEEMQKEEMKTNPEFKLGVPVPKKVDGVIARRSVRIAGDVAVRIQTTTLNAPLTGSSQEKSVNGVVVVIGKLLAGKMKESGALRRR